MNFLPLLVTFPISMTAPYSARTAEMKAKLRLEDEPAAAHSSRDKTYILVRL